ncbi:MAG: hypothetical protein ACYC69_03135 [Thermodesulfovibrionales bacterium]
MTKAVAFLVIAVFIAAAVPVQAGGLSSNLLLSSAWCTFSYNKITGYSNSSRLRFSPNGTYSSGSRSEGYSSGRSGSMASQGDSGGDGSWKVVAGELYLSEGYGQLEPVQTVVKYNSNGYPVIVADGVEYSQCR